MRMSYVIVFVRDMKRSVTFYRDVLHLPLRFESPEWTEFATGGTTLALHAAAEAGKPHGASPSAATAHPGFSVPDLRALHAELTAAGVPCRQPPRDLHGTLLAEYADPDGLPLSISQDRG